MIIVDNLRQLIHEEIENARRNEKQIGQKFGTKLNVKKKVSCLATNL